MTIRWFLAGLWVALALGQTVAQQGGAERELQPGVPLERELPRGEHHNYRVSIISGQYFQLVVDAHGVPITVTLVSPKDESVAKWGAGAEEARAETLLAIAQTTGVHRLTVRLTDDRAESAPYSVLLHQPHAATQRDRVRVSAEKTLAEGYELEAKSDPKSLRAAIEKYLAALEMFQSLGERAREARVLRAVGDIHEELGEIPVALEYLTRMLSAAEAAGPLVQMGALSHLGGFHRARFEYQKGLDYLEQALALARKVDDPLGQAVALNNMAAIYGQMGDNRKGVEYQERAVHFYHVVGNLREEAIGRNNLGRFYQVLGEYQKALEHLWQSLELRQRVRDERGEGITLNNIGLVYDTIGEYPRALDYYHRALAKRQKLQDWPGIANVLNNLGAVHSGLGELDKALDCYQQALPIRRKLVDRRGEAQTLNNIGMNHLKRAAPDLPKAIDYFRDAIKLWQSVKDQNGEAISTLNLGKGYARSGQRDLALQQFALALEKMRSVGAYNLEPAVLRDMAALAKSGGDLAEARKRIEEALSIVEEIRTRIVGPAERASWLALVSGIYELHIDVLMAQGETTVALEWAERAKARSLLDTLAAAGVDLRQGVDEKLLGRERTLRRQAEARSVSQRRMLGAPHTPQQEAEAAKALEAAVREHQEAVAAIRAASPGYAALVQPQPLKLQEIQQEVLDPETALLEYALGDERSFLWVVTRARVVAFELAPREEIERLARRFHELLRSRDGRVEAETSEQRRLRLAGAEAELPRTAAALSRLLLQPAAAQLAVKRLAVVAGGALQYVPFAALPAPGAPDGRLLLAAYEVVHLPSASTLALLRRQFANRPNPPGLLAVLADPVFDPEDPRVLGVGRSKPTAAAASPSNKEPPVENWQRAARAARFSGNTLWLPRLRASREEARLIASLAPPQARLLALDFQASRATARSDRLSRYRMLHFSTHGFFHSQHPDLSGLVLSLVDERGRHTDGFLRLHEISDLKLLADLVVLSACQTALGREIQGEGLVGLARAFMHAGAARVVASLWMVDDQATAELMKSFYRTMLGPQRTGPAAALRAAQLALWKQPRWRSPYYWAAFSLQGDWNWR